MTDVLQSAIAAVPNLIPRRIVRYKRGEDHIGLHATVGSTRIDYEDEHGVRLRAEVRDYLIKPADLVISDVTVEPEEGDEIIDSGEGGIPRTYQVMGVESGRAWRWTDRYHTMYRIHTKQTDEVEG